MANPIAVPGTVVPSGSLTTPGGAQGVQGPTAVSTDAGNIATLGSDSLILVPQSSLWSMRLRSFQALGNNTFEVDQRTCFTGVINTGWALDRWQLIRGGTMTATATSVGTAGLVALPGTNFNITQYFLRTTLTGQQVTLGAGDYLFLYETAESIALREICSDVMSLQVLVRSSVAGLNFGITLRDGGTTHTLAKLATIPSANTWTLLQFSNLPSFASSWAALQLIPGNTGFYINIGLAVGATNTVPANNTWQNGSWVQAAGADNFASKPVNSTFDCAYVGLEPGPVCSTPMDCSFSENLVAVKRYYQKSYDYSVKVGTASQINGAAVFTDLGAAGSIAYGCNQLAVEMAKAPTFASYDTSTGNVNSAQLVGFGGFGVSSLLGNTKAITQLGNAGGNFPAGYPVVLAQWSADTGW
jgi:hypothetical protein